MNTNKLLSAALVAAAFAVIYFPPDKIAAQEMSSKGEFGNRFSPAIQMVVDGDTNASRQRTIEFGLMDPIGVLPNEQIGITLASIPTSRISSAVGIAPRWRGDFRNPKSFGGQRWHS